MNKKYDFDYIIIGSGAAGRAAGLKLAKAKKRVAIVEGREFGGAEINSYDVPYQVSLDFTHSYSRLAAYPALMHQPVHYNFPTIVTNTSEIIAKLRSDAVKTCADAGITIINGFAHFLDPNTIAVNGANYTAANFILATGSQPKTREISGLDTVNYLTPATALKTRRLPKYVFVIGGGPTGVQIASYFAELGTKVIIMERAARLLPHEDKEVSATITDYFENELGVMAITSSKVVAIEQDNLSKRVIFNTAGLEKMVRIDCIVLATGSEPSLDYGLENAGVTYKKSGITVDKSFQTSARNIYAISDAIGCTNSTTARANYQGRALAESLIHKTTKTSLNYAGFTRLIHTFPEVATIGMNEYDLLSSDHRYKKSLVYFKDLPVSTINRLDHGFVKLLADAQGRLLGATVVAPHANLFSGELSLAIRQKRDVSTLSTVPYPANSYLSALSIAASKLAK